MNNEDKEFLREGLKIGIWAFAICVLLNIVFDLRDIQTELENVKREHHVIIEYKNITDTIYIIKDNQHAINYKKFTKDNRY